MQKKIAAVHDISGFGRCALTTAIPVLSASGIQCCPVPSAVLSAHTAFQGVTFRDLTGDLEGFIRNWADIGVRLDGIYSGYLGSEQQIELVLLLKELCGKADCRLIVDPVMGDNGKAYSIVGHAGFVEAMRGLCAAADIITPNLTECALLLGMAPDGFSDTEEAAERYMRELAELGPSQVVVTGLTKEDQVGAGYYDRLTGESGFVFHAHVPVYYPGTGDLFTSVLTARLCGEQPCSLRRAVETAAYFVRDCAQYTQQQGSPAIEGVQFEKLIGRLIPEEA